MIPKPNLLKVILDYNQKCASNMVVSPACLLAASLIGAFFLHQASFLQWFLIGTSVVLAIGGTASGYRWYGPGSEMLTCKIAEWYQERRTTSPHSPNQGVSTKDGFTTSVRNYLVRECSNSGGHFHSLKPLAERGYGRCPGAWPSARQVGERVTMAKLAQVWPAAR